MRYALATFVVAALGGVASAQSSNPMSYEAMAKAKQGTWSEYSMELPGGQKVTTRYAIVEKNEREMTMETDAQSPMGPVHISMTFAPSPPDTWKLVKGRMQMGTQPARDVPAAQLGQGSVKKGESMGKLVGAEKITVPGGTFETKHYKRELPKEAGGMTIDVWMSDKAVPTGVVKLSGGGVEMVLASTGTGAKAKPEATPASKPADTTKK